MPIRISNTAGGQAYADPFTSENDDAGHVKLDVSVLTTDEVDAYGYLKPGVPLKSDGTLVSGAGQTVYLVTTEPIQIAEDNSALAGDTSDPLIGGRMSGTINRDIAEDNLGRAYSANELAALALGGFKVTTT